MEFLARAESHGARPLGSAFTGILSPAVLSREGEASLSVKRCAGLCVLQRAIATNAVAA
jgi:hypothetical protein